MRFPNGYQFLFHLKHTANDINIISLHKESFHGTHGQYNPVGLFPGALIYHCRFVREINFFVCGQDCNRNLFGRFM